MKLKEIFDQSDMIIEPWPNFEANCFRVGGLCRSAFNTSNFNQASVVIICQCIVNVTHTPVSTQSSDNMGKKLSQNREMGKSCSGYSQDTSAQFTIVTDNR